jgi:glycosyltransferase involved in cell wall biosynthesis
MKVLMAGPALDVQGGISSVEKLILQYMPKNVEMSFLGTMEDGSASHKLAVFLRALRKAKAMMAKADVVHVHFSVTGSTARKSVVAGMAKKMGIPLILHAHGSDYREFFERQRGWMKRRILRFLGSADVFIALSESWKDFYADVCGVDREKIVVLSNPIVCGEIPKRESAGPVYLFLGIMDERKGAMDLVKAFAKVSERVTDAKLIMAGNGDVDGVRKLTEELGVGNSSEIHGWIDAAERNRLFKKANVFVLPSFREGVPMAMLESMAVGLPPIVTPVGGIPEVITDKKNGLLVEPGNVDEIAEAMLAMADSALREQIGLCAWEKAQEYDIRKYCDTLAAIYADLSGQRAS